MPKAASPPDTLSAPYIPWKSFENYVAGLKKTGTVPHTLDSSARPSSMAGGLWRSLVAGLKFLRLIEPDGRATERFHKLVKAHGTADWSRAVREFVLPAYSAIKGDLPLENATAAQLDKRFREHAQLEGQMLRKAERFYLHALREAGVKYSSLFSMRRESTGTNGKRRATGKRSKRQKPKVEKSSTHHKDEMLDRLPEGMIELPIPLGNTASCIRVPRNITVSQIPLVRAIFNTVEALAKQNSGVEETG